MLLRSGQAVSVVGSRVSLIAFPLLVLALTGSPAQAGVVSFFNTLPNVLFTLPAGAMVDRWDRKRLMILCDTGRVLAIGSLVAALHLSHLSVVQLVLVAFSEGTFSVFFTLSESAAVPRVVPPDQLSAAVSVNESTRRGAELIGPSVGGLLFGLGRTLPFLVDTISYLISVLSLLLIKTTFQEQREVRVTTLRQEIGEGLRWVWHERFVRASLFLVAGSNLLFEASSLIVIVLAQRLHASAAVIGVIFSLFGVGGLVGAVAAPWVGRWLSLAQIVIGANWVWALLWPLFAIVPHPLLLGVISAVMALVGATWNVALGSYTLALIPDALRGRVRSVSLLIAWGTIPVGAVLSGLLLQIVGPISAVLITACAMLGLAAAATFTPDLRNAPAGPVVQTS
ncbi:MAG: MFS transporter [Chloroflexota bacterium]